MSRKINSSEGYALTAVAIGIAALLTLGGSGWLIWKNQNKVNNQSLASQSQNSGQQEAEKKAASEPDEEYQIQGALLDVTMAKTVRGVQTGGKSSGEAKARFVNGKYDMVATFKDLPDAKGEDFYEGWVVRRNPFEFLSSGKLVKVNGVYSNEYTSNEDLTTHDFYVLTLEPNDNDPAPADHIVEGGMTR